MKTTRPDGSVHIDYDYYNYIDEQHAKAYKHMRWRRKLIWIRLIASVLIGFFIVFGIAAIFCI